MQGKLPRTLYTSLASALKRTRHRSWGLVIALTVAGPASAQGYSAAECADSHFAAQSAREEGKLLQTEKHLLSCSHQTCPGVLQAECAGWLKEIAGEIPSIVVAATAESGEDLLKFSVELDGAEAHLTRTGLLRLDPGPHNVTIHAEGYSSTSRKLQVRLGETHRREEFRLSPEFGSSAQLDTRNPLPAWPLWTLGGLVALGTGGFIGWGLSARTDERSLASDCEPTCHVDRVAGVRQDYLLANVSLAVAGAAAVGAGVYYIVRRRSASRVLVGVSAQRPGFIIRGSF